MKFSRPKEEWIEILLEKRTQQNTENYTGVVTYSNGDKYYFKEGILHREDGPAAIHRDGTKVWVLWGKRVSPQEVFDRMTEKQKMEVVWKLDEWK